MISLISCGLQRSNGGGGEGEGGNGAGGKEGGERFGTARDCDNEEGRREGSERFGTVREGVEASEVMRLRLDGVFIADAWLVLMMQTQRPNLRYLKLREGGQIARVTHKDH
jgi:hypothetical protein